MATRKSIRQATLRRRAKAYGKRVTSNKAPPIAIAFVGDGWLDGYKAAIDDARKVMSAPGSMARTVNDIVAWLEEQP